MLVMNVFFLVRVASLWYAYKYNTAHNINKDTRKCLSWTYLVSMVFSECGAVFLLLDLLSRFKNIGILLTEKEKKMNIK